MPLSCGLFPPAARIMARIVESTTFHLSGSFFTANPISYFNVQNYSLRFTNSSYATVSAMLWYVLGNGSSVKTLEIPYLLEYSYQNSTWSLVGESWGLSSSPGSITAGVVSPIVSTIVASSTTTTSTTSNPPASSSSSTSRLLQSRTALQS